MSRRAAVAVALASWIGQTASAAAQPALPEGRPASAQALLEAQPEERIEKLMQERVVLLPSEGLPQGQVEALVVFSQPTEKVWELMLQRERQTEYRPEIVRMSVVSRDGEVVIEEQHLKIAFLDIGYRLRDQLDPGAHTITWALDPTFESTLQHVSGYWELHALDAARTLARFGTKVSVSPAVPSFLQNGITRKNVPQSLENTRQWVDSDGRWRP